jgi:uncharacterized RDD family membrane protein YckC
MTDAILFTGQASKDRFLAAICDNLLSIITAVVVASFLSGSTDVVRGSAFVGTYLAYYLLSEGLLGATPGKMVFGLRVRRLSGESCTWLQAGIRTLLRVIEVNPVLLGALPAGIVILATKRKQRLGDMLAGTVVVSSGQVREA